MHLCIGTLVNVSKSIGQDLIRLGRNISNIVNILEQRLIDINCTICRVDKNSTKILPWIVYLIVRYGIAAIWCTADLSWIHLGGTFLDARKMHFRGQQSSINVLRS